MIALLLSSPAYAAFKSSADAIKPEETFNPQPKNDDIILPMPCGLSLALKAISVPQGGLIRDKSFPMGITNAGDSGRQIYEHQFPGHIAAPFTRADLPNTWKSKLTSGGRSDAWYFIGKYEVSKLQWDSVINVINAEGDEDQAACPKQITQAMKLPVTDISWFEAQDFLNRYNAWLVKYHLKSLPAFSGTRNIAFLRLPTEEEWEYAARGGAHVPPEWWAEQDLFPIAEGKTINDYAVTSMDNVMQGPLPIGSRLPNPAGVHDTAGNAREMVDGFFRMSIPDMRNGQVIRRLHGASGGILTKGGTYASTKNEYFPGWRDEVPLYTAEGPGRAPDLGFRVALAGLNVPNAQRLNLLRAESGKPQADSANPENLGSTPLEAINALAARADGTLKTNLEKLRELIESRELAQESENLKTLENGIRSLLYQSETLRAFAFKYLAAKRQLETVRKVMSEKMGPEARAKGRQALEMAERDLKDYMQTLKMGANYYKVSLGAVVEKDAQEVERLLEQIRKEYSSSTIFDEHMRKNLETLRKFLTTARKRGVQFLGTHKILADIIPENQFKRLGI